MPAASGQTVDLFDESANTVPMQAGKMYKDRLPGVFH
jgi:hypothetical protein